MPIGLRLNTALLSPLRNLSKSVEEGASARERLSSGLRINKASDDAAGLAVANSVDIDRRVYTQGLRNVNDGISYLNVAEGAVTEMGNIVTRLKELTSQGSSSTLGAAQRDAINEEVTSLSKEYNRILRYASFNDIDLLSADNSSLTIGAGYSGSSINLDLSVGRATLPSNDELGGSLVTGIIQPGSISYDGRYVSYHSVDALVVGDVNTRTDVFLEDRELGSIELISVSSAGVQGNSTSFFGQVSGDGRYVAFYGSSSNLVAGDVNAVSDVFLRDRETDTTTLVSQSTAGVKANGVSDVVSISADGRYVAFRSDATNLVAGDVNGVSDIFVRDTVAGTTTLVSKSTGGVAGNGTSSGPAISADGRYVVYTSLATNLVSGDTNGTGDVYRYEIATGTTERVSIGVNGEESIANPSYNNAAPSISADGRYVSFNSVGVFTSDTPGIVHNIWRKDMETGEILLVTRSYDGGYSNDFSWGSSISADGNFVSYYSTATNLVEGDTNGYTDIFTTDIQANVTRMASKSDSGVLANGDSSGGGNPYMSGNGEYIVFRTMANNLVSGGSLGTQPGVITGNPLFEDNVVNLMTGISVATASYASSSLERLDDFENEIVNIKGIIGAYSSRLSSASATLSSSILSYEDAYSRIMDADIAAEATRVVQADLRTQSGLVAVQQAGKLSQLALDLLQNSFGD